MYVTTSDGRACAHGDAECAIQLLADSSAAGINMGVLRKDCRLSVSFMQAAYSRGGSDNRGSDNRGSPDGRSGGSAEQLQALAMLSGNGMLTSNGIGRPAGSLRSHSGSFPSGALTGLSSRGMGTGGAPSGPGQHFRRLCLECCPAADAGRCCIMLYHLHG